MLIRFFALLFFGSNVAAFAQQVQPTATPSVVYSIRNPEAISQYQVNAPVVRAMVDRLVMAVTNRLTVASAWASLVAPTDKIGIKISAAGGQLFTTHRAIVEAVVDGLVAAGHARSSIIVWDRQLAGIKDAGYRPGAEGFQLLAIEPREGYDAKATFTAPVLGKLIWGDLDYIPRHGESPLGSENANTSNVSHFAKILAHQVTKIINLPVMSDSGATGLAGCIHNVTLPNIDNWRRFTQFGNTSAYAMAELYADPMIRPKVVLNLMDGLLVSYADGPESHPNFAVHQGRLLASKDPVAIDALALQTIEPLRAQAKLPPIGELAAHVSLAGQMGIGNAEPARITVKEIGR
ncbi:MAG: DUF362 domain-containing protein [Chthoniobacterales bacterium]